MRLFDGPGRIAAPAAQLGFRQAAVLYRHTIETPAGRLDRGRIELILERLPGDARPAIILDREDMTGNLLGSDAAAAALRDDWLRDAEDLATWFPDHPRGWHAIPGPFGPWIGDPGRPPGTTWGIHHSDPRAASERAPRMATYRELLGPIMATLTLACPMLYHLELEADPGQPVYAAWFDVSCGAARSLMPGRPVVPVLWDRLQLAGGGRGPLLPVGVIKRGELDGLARNLCEGCLLWGAEEYYVDLACRRTISAAASGHDDQAIARELIVEELHGGLPARFQPQTDARWIAIRRQVEDWYDNRRLTLMQLIAERGLASAVPDPLEVP